MSDNGLSAITSIITGLVSSLGTGPLGNVELPEADLGVINGTGESAWVIQVNDEMSGKLSFSSEERAGLRLADYPEDFLNAVLAAEDSRFPEHAGADPVGIASAVADTIMGRTRGGSSITQQLIKNSVVGNEMTMQRKVEELILAVRLEASSDKTQIFESYLRYAWFGRGANGAAHASRVWFGKPWSELNLAECATLAAMLKGPARFDPEKNPELVKSRRNLIISEMLQYGWVTEEEAEEAKNEEVIVIPKENGNAGDHWVISAIRRAAYDYADSRGLTLNDDVTLNSTISARWQAIASESISEAELPEDVEAAMVIISIPEGNLLASVGGRDQRKSGYDRTVAMRQPGSLSKPLFYAAALDAGMTPWDLVRNDRIDWGGTWNPANYDGSTTPPAPMYQGLEASSNLMTIHLADFVPMEQMFRTAEMSGAWDINGIDPFAPSLLGATETTLMRITSGLAGLVNQGRTVPVKVFMEDAPAPSVFLSQHSADAVSAMMRGVMLRGTASVANKSSKVSIIGKTGTSQNYRDAWFVGLTPHIAIGVWAGKDDDTSMGGGRTGGVVSSRIAINAFNKALESGLISEQGFVPGEFIGAHAQWPPTLIGPENDTLYSGGQEFEEMIVIDNTVPERSAGRDQVDEFLNQLDSGFW